MAAAAAPIKHLSPFAMPPPPPESPSLLWCTIGGWGDACHRPDEWVGRNKRGLLREHRIYGKARPVYTPSRHDTLPERVKFTWIHFAEEVVEKKEVFSITAALGTRISSFRLPPPPFMFPLCSLHFICLFSSALFIYTMRRLFPDGPFEKGLA